MKKRIVAVVLLLFVALVLRLYKIEEHTEFLGDQGSAGVVIYESFLNRTIPLLGPAVSTGQRPGPFFYYLIAPSLILFNFNPVAPAVFFAFLSVISVFLLWYLGTKLYSFWIGMALATFWAVSPLLVTQGRTFWNPSPIPILSAFLLFCFYKIHTERRYWYFLLIGFINAALVQLHYSNIISILVSIIFCFIILIQSRKQKMLKTVFLWSIGGIGVFLVVLSPFIFYEVTHGFENIRSVLLMFLFPDIDKTIVVQVKNSPLTMSSNVFWYILPISNTNLMLLVQAIVLLLPFFLLPVWYRFGMLWYLSGIVLLSFYKGPMYDHYLSMFLPLAFLIFGALLSGVEKYIPKAILIILVSCLIGFQISRLDVASSGNMDIPRTREITAEMIRQSNGKPFSFTLIGSRSFSDYHYRFFFRMNNVRPVDTENKEFRTLFLVCDKTPCPPAEDVQKRDELQVVCFDLHCKTWYPHLFMSDWQLVTWKDLVNGRLYTFARR